MEEVSFCLDCALTGACACEALLALQLSLGQEGIGAALCAACGHSQRLCTGLRSRARAQVPWGK